MSFNTSFLSNAPADAGLDTRQHARLHRAYDAPRMALGKAVPAEDLKAIERHLNLHHPKWDTHVGDRCVLSPEPLLLDVREWEWLSAKAEAATRDLLALERAIAEDAAVQRLIGVPWNVTRVLREHEGEGGVRTFRFDFHPTTSGWALSEVNSDVPGGFGEASLLPPLYQRYTIGAPLSMNPLKEWGEAIQSQACGRVAGLLCAPGFLEDEQVVRFLARELRGRGFSTCLIQTPSALKWKGGTAVLRNKPGVRLDVLVRFYQLEWLASLPSWTGSMKLLMPNCNTLVTNPTIAALSESKRLGLCFRRLSKTPEQLAKLLPECREPAEIADMPQEDWVLKAAYSNTGDEIHLGSQLSRSQWGELMRKACRAPSRWVAQRRFETLALQSAAGPVKPCVGVFVINGRTAGAYVRLSRSQITDAYALEAPLFLMPDQEAR